MKKWHPIFSAALLALASCNWTGAQPSKKTLAKQKAPEILIAHVAWTAEGDTPETLNQYASLYAQDLLREHKATRVTTLSTFDKCDIYVQYPGGSLASARSDMSAMIAKQSWLANAAISEITAVSPAGMLHGVGVVRMQTIYIFVDPSVLASFPDKGLDVEQVAAAVREIYPGGPANQETLDKLKALTLKTKTGGTIPFSSLAALQLQDSEDPIIRAYP